MASSFRQWESDPLFSAAEVIQDSADRMESLLRLVLHEQCLVQEHHPDPKLIGSLEYHRRDLATTLETAKWQLEDFELEVSASAAVDKSHTRENVLSRHKQFVSAIREQIFEAERSLGDTLARDLSKGSQWVNLDEQDRNGLALFLSGKKSGQQVSCCEAGSSNTMRRFLDATVVSSSKHDIIEHNTGDTENMNMNGFVNSGPGLDAGDKASRDVGSHYNQQVNFEAASSTRERVEDGSWDLEANEASDKSFFCKSKLRGYYGRMNIMVWLGNLLSGYRGRGPRSSAKRLKDVDKERHAPSRVTVSHAVQINLASAYRELSSRLMQSNWLRECRMRCRRSPYLNQFSQCSRKLILAVLVTLIFLGILAYGMF